MRTRDGVLWTLRVTWAVLPVLAGTAFSSLAAERSTSVHAVVVIEMWVIWLIALVALLVPSTVSLTTVRVLVPLPFAVTVLTLFTRSSLLVSNRPSVVEIALAAAGSIVVLGLAYSAVVGRVFVQGSAYGDEARLPLRPPGALVFGPIPLLWLVVVTGALVPPILLAAKAWVIGIISLAIGIPAAHFGLRVLHRLSRRWLVFVPAGVVVHDHLVLADSIMVRRVSLEAVSPAPADTDAEDLTGNALGLALEFRLRDDTPILLAGKPGAASGTPKVVRSFMVTPSRPGEVLAEAARRKLRVSN